MGNLVYSVNGVYGKPCSNAKFTYIADLPNIVKRSSYDAYLNEQIDALYLDNVLMAERIMGSRGENGKLPEVHCFIFNYTDEKENEQVS